MRAALPAIGVLLGLCACPGAKGPADTFVAGTAEVTFVPTSDNALKIPLAAGVKWEAPITTKDTLLKVRGEPGPTFVVATDISYAPKPVALATCADAHRGLVEAALSKGGVLSTRPVVSDEVRGGVRVPRMHYAVPLEANGTSRPASTLSSWTYFLVGTRCIAVGVTTVVKSKPDDPNHPDPEDLNRLDRVFGEIAERTVKL
ncbi:MAG: hypothetical protein ACXVEF_29505 [Polyangiales bacterium]